MNSVAVCIKVHMTQGPLHGPVPFGIRLGFMSVCTRICLRFKHHFCTRTKRLYIEEFVSHVRQNFLINLEDFVDRGLARVVGKNEGDNVIGS